MLKKLIKHDLKYGVRMFAVLHIILIIGCLMARFLVIDHLDFSADPEEFAPVIALLIVVLTMLFSAISFGCCIMYAVRFYKNLFTDEAEVEEQIEAYIDGKTEELPLAVGEHIGRTVDYAAGRNRYIGHLISLATRSFKDMKIGLDCANGSSSSIAKSVYDALGAKTYVISNEPDGVNINTNCGSTHIEKLQAFVKENNLDVGFAYDGDADRCIAVDENGNVVDGDLILYVCGKYLMEQGRLAGNTIVTTVMSNLGLYKACDKVGMKYEQTAVGDKYVYENMMKNGFVLGGEQSGHIIFSKHA